MSEAEITALGKRTSPTWHVVAVWRTGTRGIVTPQIAEEARAINPNIRTVQIAASGHNIRRENFADYLAAVRAFLS